MLPPTLSQVFERISQLSPREVLTEANGWVVSATTLGIGAGTLMADASVGAAGTQCEVAGWRDVRAIAAGYLHTADMTTDGRVVAVGDNSHGQCDVGQWRDVVAVAAGSTHTLGLCSDGTVLAAGSDDDGQCATTARPRPRVRSST